MDKIILGLLMTQQLTIYEIKNFIGQNLQSICSDSMGSIHATIKKLLDLGLIGFDEKVEKSVNKKTYYITDLGIQQFSNWVEQAMVVGKTKNMELSKLFFMGIVSKEKQIELIRAYLEALRTETAYLEGISKTLKNSIENIQQTARNTDGFTYFKNNARKYSGDLDPNLIDNTLKFESFTLEYGIKINQFDIDFYEEILKRIQE